jgi:hypothetical protein
MSYLWFCALVSLVFGLLLLASPEVMGSLGSVLNSALFVLNGQTMRYRVGIGIVLLVVSAWVFYIGLQYPAWYLTATWIVALVFGLLYLLLPGWLNWLSKASNALLVSTDDLVIGWRRVIGIVLIVTGIYIVYGIFASMR